MFYPGANRILLSEHNDCLYKQNTVDQKGEGSDLHHYMDAFSSNIIATNPSCVCSELAAFCNESFSSAAMRTM